jgi:hypothetical protein
MRTITLTTATLLALGASAVAQSSPAGMPGIDVPPSGDTVALPPIGAAPPPGVTIDDDVSRKAVKGAHCSASAMETDGTTTCIGVPGTAPNSRKRGR